VFTKCARCCCSDEPTDSYGRVIQGPAKKKKKGKVKGQLFDEREVVEDVKKTKRSRR